MTGPTDDEVEEVRNAVSLDDLLDEIFKRRKESKPYLYPKITEDVVKEMMPDASEEVRKKVVSDLGIQIWGRMAEEAQAKSGTESGITSLGKSAIVGRISKRRHPGKDAAAGAEVEDRRDVIAS